MIEDKLLKLYTDGKWCLDGVPYSGETKSSAFGTLRWYKDGRYHREDGPAIEYAGGSKYWCIHGQYMTTWKEYHKLTTLSPQEQMVVKLRYGEHLE